MRQPENIIVWGAIRFCWKRAFSWRLFSWRLWASWGSLCLLVCVHAGLVAQAGDSGDSLTVVDSLFFQAQEQLEAEQWGEVIQSAEEVWERAKLGPQHEKGVEALLLMGRASRMLDDSRLALRNYLQALEELEKMGNLRRRAQVELEVGRLFHEMGLAEKAIDYYFSALDKFESQELETGQIETLKQMGRAYAELDSVEEALKHYANLLEFYREGEATDSLVHSLQMMVSLYKRNGEYNKALGHNFEILEWLRAEKDSAKIANVLNNIGYNFFNLKNFERAYKFFEETLEMDSLLNSSMEQRMRTRVNMSICLQRMGDYNRALEQLLAVEAHWREQENPEQVAETQNTLALVYLQKGDLHNASLYSRSCVALAEQVGKLRTLAGAYLTHSEVLQTNNDFENAMEFYKKHLIARDSMVRSENVQRQVLVQKQIELNRLEQDLKLLIANEEVEDLAIRQMELESEKREQAFRLLQREKELQDLELRQSELEEARRQQSWELERSRLEAALKQEEVQRLQDQEELQRLALDRQSLRTEQQKLRIDQLEEAKRLQQEREATRRRFITGIGLLVVIILALLLVGYLQNRRTNRQLARQKKAIEHTNAALEQKNEEILSQSENLQQMNQALEQKRHEAENAYKQLKNAQTQLVHSEKMASLGQLTAGIAHEINNPINYVSTSVSPLLRNFLDLKELFQAYSKLHESDKLNGELDRIQQLRDDIEADYLFEEMELLLKGIDEGARRTKNIVAGLRNFSRLDEDDLKQAQVQEGLDATLVLLQNHTKKGIEVIREYAPDLPKIDCYPGKLNQVFMNIFNNAIQAMEGQGELRIKTEYLERLGIEREQAAMVSGDGVRISISDTGKGMSPEVKSRVFDPFFTTKDVGEGTGLGMSISYGIIEQHKGSIAVESEEGKGTTFIIQLPRSQH